MLLVVFGILLHLVCSCLSGHLIELKILLDEGKKHLLSQPGLVRSLADMLATATPDGKEVAAGCLRNLAVSGSLFFV